ncbi:hypothetical protein EIP91_011815 [Steccherinum ochraceum]|uniref:CorA metal ion transporter n=1 Tax=Steccherinum ochraceum TaxID=92696 RepID=A0A4R0RHQ4_9APHY|nr:hypothetical protein EIP91_011815 [Steccherinum ochraceum]
MPRENSFSDSDGRSLTPDLEDEVAVPISPASNAQSQDHPHAHFGQVHDNKSHKSHISHKSLKSHISDALSHHGSHHGEPSRGRPTVDVLDTTQSAPPELKSPRSVRSSSRRRAQASEPALRTTTFATPGDRFRSTVRKVMAMRRTSSLMINRGIGAEPGVDPRRASAFLNYGHIKQQCMIEVVDYSAVRSSFGRMTNTEFVQFMGNAQASAREPWVKVRWINVGGISWDVISAMAMKYDMHPLSLEDVLHQRGHARSKADYYPKHLFLRMLSHTISDEDSDAPADVTHLPTSMSPEPMDDEDDSEDGDDSWQSKGQAMFGMDDEKTVIGSASGSRFSTNRSNTMRNTIRRKFNSALPDPEMNGSAPSSGRFGQAVSTSVDKKDRKNARNVKIIRELKKGDRVNVKIQPMCIFLFRDGTVISIHPDSRLNFTAPITERLRQRDTGLRTTADPSLLVQSLIDLMVDQALEVVEEYQSKILSLEHNVLLKPSMKSVRRLHILQGDLILHKRTLEPIKTVVYGLRRYDVDRVAAMAEMVDPSAKIEGYMSHKSKIYLADVHDHMEYVLSSLDMFAGISENLINYTFNMTSYEMNEVMRRLTLATIIFLPLTLLTGYFGMNFTNMWTIGHNHTDLVFWAIALPVMGIVIPIFLWNDLTRMWHYAKKRMVQRTVKKEVKTTFKNR